MDKFEKVKNDAIEHLSMMCGCVDEIAKKIREEAAKEALR